MGIGSSVVKRGCALILLGRAGVMYIIGCGACRRHDHPFLRKSSRQHHLFEYLIRVPSNNYLFKTI